MKSTHSDRIFSDIESLLQEVKTYFEGIVSEDMQSELYESRIAAELGARIENLNGVVQSTLLAYLDQDAQQAISDWKSVDKNRYYDKKIRDQVSAYIQEAVSFEPKTFPEKYVKIPAGAIAAGGIYRAVSASDFPSGALIIALAAGMFFLLPPVINKHNKQKILAQLDEYLGKVEDRYKEQAQKIIDEYVSHFNEITPEK